jgi:hypothetical protein
MRRLRRGSCAFFRYPETVLCFGSSIDFFAGLVLFFFNPVYVHSTWNQVFNK